MSRPRNPYGDGLAAGRLVRVLEERLDGDVEPAVAAGPARTGV